MNENTQPIMLGDTVHIIPESARSIWHSDEYVNYSGIVISISPRYEGDSREMPKEINGKVITVFNFEDKKNDDFRWRMF